MRKPARLAVVVGAVFVVLVAVGATLVPSDSSAGPGPIQTALGLVGDGSASASAALDRRRAAEVARRTTDCMVAAGFDVVARPELALTIPDSDLDPVTWAQRWGFGISTSVGIAPDVEPAAVDASLNPAARRAMFGGPDEPGCHDRARTEVYGLRDRLLAPLQASFAELQATVDADPRMVPVVESWRSCAAAAAAPVSAHVDRRSFGESVLTDFAKRAADVTGAAALQRLQAEERQLATALAVCEQGFVAGRDDVARPHEATFVEVHRSVLKAVGGAIRAAEAAYPADPGP